MLLQFSVKNYKSIKKKAVISMKASKDPTMKECLFDEGIVPALALYGANAAGKTNVLDALILMKEMVCGDYAQLLKGCMLPHDGFAFTDRDSPTSFEIIYFYKGIKYSYGFSFDKKKIREEYLYYWPEWPKGSEKSVFLRKGSEYCFSENIEEQIVLGSRTSEQRLYLTCSSEWNCKQTEKAYLWFLNLMTKTVEEKTIGRVKDGGFEKHRIIKEMIAADLGICDVIISDNVVKTVHKIRNRDYFLNLDKESMGTRKFFSRIGSWLDALEKGAVLLVDEIESSMHPLLARYLVEMFQDPSINKNRAQLIFTTQDTGFLDSTLMRRDQIWFVEKNEKTMETKIYSLMGFSPREEENVAKSYLQGRYGAIPFIYW